MIIHAGVQLGLWAVMLFISLKAKALPHTVAPLFGQCFYTAIGTECYVWAISSERFTDVMISCSELQIIQLFCVLIESSTLQQAGLIYYSSQ